MKARAVTGLAMIAVAGSLFLSAKDAQAQTGCGTELENPLDAFTPNGIGLGALVAENRNADGEVESYVIAEEGFMYGYLGSRRVLPPEYVEIAAGRAKVLIRDKDGLQTFPNC